MPDYQPGTYAVTPNIHLLPKIKGATLSVYTAICHHTDEDRECYPSQVRIAKMTGYSTEQVRRAVNELVSLGVLEKTNRVREGGSKASNLYRVIEVPPHTGEGGIPQKDNVPTHSRGASTHMGVGSLTNPISTNPLPSISPTAGTAEQPAGTKQPEGDTQPKSPTKPRAQDYREWVQALNTAVKKNYRPLPAMQKKYWLRRKVYDREEMLEACAQAKRSSWHSGDNPSGWVATQDYMLRNDTNIESLLAKKTKSSGAYQLTDEDLK